MLMPCHHIRIQSALFRDAHNGGITSRTASKDSRRSSSFLTNRTQRASASASIDSGTTSASTSTFRKSGGRGANTNSTTPSDDKEERFERVEMENAGAYRLIDRRTGDHVIVWGGAHDPVAPIPSHLLLSPPQPHPQPGTATATAPGEIEASRSSGQSRGFAKLKVQKVKSLMMRKSSSSQSQSRSRPQSQFQVKTRSTMPMPIPGNKTLISHDNDDDDDDDDQIEYERPSSDGSDDDISDHNSSSSGDAALFSRGRGRGGGGGATRAGASSPRMRGWSGVSSADHYSYSSDREDVPRKSLAIDRAFFSKTSFKNLGCTSDMITALSSLMFLRPSHIQAMAFRAVLEGKSCIIADQSGSGKTLAYLCPLIQRLRREEEALALAKSEPSPGCPRVIVLAPTAELASQVLSNCRLISKSGVPFRSMVATGGFKQKTQLESLQQGLDVLIATPGRLLYLYQYGFLQFSHLQCVVLDEVDILYGEEGFEQVLQSLISAAPVSVQYLFVTATLPLEIYNKVVEVFPDCEVLMGPGMHRTSSGLEEVLVDCSGGETEEKNPETAFSNKKNALLKLVQESPARKTIVFCNKIETCRKIENVLKRVDRKEARVRVLPFHAALTQDVRIANLKEFLKSQSADSMFLVCTDRASRGIDFKEVDQVVLFDFPREPSEYVRRVGRTARGAGGVGKAYVFAVGKQVPLAGRIIKRNQKGHPLHHVPTTYELQ